MNEEQKSKCLCTCHPHSGGNPIGDGGGYFVGCEHCTPPQPQKQLSDCEVCLKISSGKLKGNPLYWATKHTCTYKDHFPSQAPESPKPSQPEEEKIKWHECECGRVFSQAMVDYQLDVNLSL